MGTPSSLAEAFARGLAPSLAGRFGKETELEEVLAKLVTTAQQQWPSFEVEGPAFAEYLAQRVDAEASLPAIHAADLWLAFACVLGDPAALAAFDSSPLSRVPSVLRGSLPAGLTEDEVLQSLRLRLFVRSGERPPAIATYSGRGALVHWLRAAAVRLVQDFARTRKLEIATPDEALLEMPAVTGSAEVAVLKSRYGPEFKISFQEALLSLSQRDQNLLRLYYLDASSPEEIGRLYQAHRTTVWRWLSECRQALLSQTRLKLAARAKVSDAEMSSLMNAAHSELDVSLSRILREP